MDRVLLVEPYRAYGKDQFSPQCEVSKTFTELLKQKYLTRSDIEVIKRLGFKIKTREVEL